MEDQEIATFISATDGGDGFMTARYEHRCDDDTGTAVCEGEHPVEWRWSLAVAGGVCYCDWTTTLVAASFPVHFEMTAPRRDGGEETRRFDLSAPGETRTERFDWRTLCGWPIYEISYKYPVPPCCPSSEVLPKMLESGEFSDFSIIAGGTVFNLHKNVLAARSDFFAAMFRTDMKEKREGSVDLPFDKETVQEMINFIYSGQPKHLDSVAPELVKLAHMYDLKGLKKMCMDTLVKNLSNENSIGTLLIADIYDQEAYLKIMKYISKNYRQVVLTDGWKRLAAEKLELCLAIKTNFAMNS